jgi:DNA primase
MVIDTRRIKARCDLRQVVEQDLGPAPIHGGRAWLWKCPFHHERTGYSLAVWADGYRCFGACNTSGDVFDWLRTYRHLDFADALDLLGQPLAPFQEKAASERRQYGEPPAWSWQEAAHKVVEMAEETLWSCAGEGALSYLIDRGLTTTTIREARLGCIPGDWRERKTIAGLEVPCGITIPWFAGGALWMVKVRRAQGRLKYLQIMGGSTAGLYGADCLADRQAALFCEGEFDALIAQQEAGSLVTAVTLGSATNRLAQRWLPDLIHCRMILVTYDADEAGERGAERLINISPRFHPIRVPNGKDITDFYLSGGDVYEWIERILASITSGRTEKIS